MRIAVVSDIHANLEALRAVQDRIAELGGDRTVCLGDIVGYGAEPNECVETVRSAGMTCVLGNHDAVASGIEEPHDFTPHAREAALWTRSALSDANRSYLAGLPRELAANDFLLVHGSIGDTNRYVMDIDDASENFALLAARPAGPVIVLHGHTHRPIAFVKSRDVLSVDHAGTVRIHPHARYLINPGAVGQPRDGDPRASFVIYDDVARTIVRERVEYPVQACREKILRAGLPARLADRLLAGI